MKVSVITVVYNAVKDIDKTITSVMQQRYDDYEYIVVDGASTDGTVDVIRQYSKYISYWASEPDNGIYNAMNKAVRMAHGEYCIFMNAGDMFANSLVLKDASWYLSEGFDVLTGREISLRNGNVVDYVKPPALITLNHFYKSSISHQSSFIKRSLLLEYPYDETFRLVSDWKFWIQTLVLGRFSYKAIDINVSVFNHDGLTYSQKELGLKEREQVLRQLIPDSIRLDYDNVNRRSYLYKFASRVYNKLQRMFRVVILKYRMKSLVDVNFLS